MEPSKSAGAKIMRNRILLLLPLVLFIAIVFFFRAGMGRDPNLLPSMLVDKMLPAFSASSLENNIIRSEDLIGKITVLNVWASWCEACKVEQPFLMELTKNKSIQIYGLDYKDRRADAKRYLQNEGNPYHKVIFDDVGQVAMLFGVYGTPETFLIDQKGKVRYRFVGAITLETLENDLLPRIRKMQKENR